MKHILRNSFAAAMLVMAGNIAANAQGGRISTVAGTGMSGFSGDGGVAVSATFSNPSGVATDAAGNIYIADEYNGRVRKVDAVTGIVTTFAGGGSSYSYGIPPTDAHIWMPTNVFINGVNDILITDHFHDMTFVVNHTSGLIYSRCGCHTQGCDGDGGDATLAKMELPVAACEDPLGNTYIADQGCSKLRSVSTAGIVNTLISASGPTSVFINPANPNELYFAEMYNYQVKKLTISTGVVSVVAGNGVCGLTGNGGQASAASIGMPSAIFIDNSGNLYICDITYNMVHKVNSAGVIFTLAGTGTAGYSGDGNISAFAQLNNPTGIWVNASGYVYIADAGNNVIRMIKPKGLKSNGTAMNEGEMVVYPNPSTGSFTLSTDEELDNTVVTVYNMLGETVYSKALSGYDNAIDMGRQAPGIYTVAVKTASGMHTQKLNIQ